MEKTISPSAKITDCPTGGQFVRSISKHVGKSNVSYSNMYSFNLFLSHHPLVSPAIVLAAQVHSVGQDVHSRTSPALPKQKFNKEEIQDLVIKESSTHIKNMPMSWLSILFRKVWSYILIRLWITYLLLC